MNTAVYQLLTDVIKNAPTDVVLSKRVVTQLADALLASPLADIIDFAADFCDDLTEVELPEVHALLTDWHGR